MKFVAIVALLAVSACVNVPYTPNRRTAPPQPEGVQHTEERFDGEKGLKILEQRWIPQDPKAVLVVVHGLKDYSDRYMELVRALTADHVAVYALDLRGHGDSEGHRVWVDDFDDYVQDVEHVVRDAQFTFKGKPVFLMGHSMGGAIATRLVVKDQTRVDGLILSAAALKAGVGGGTRFMVGVFGTIAPTLAVLELDDSKFSRDPAVTASIAQDPMIFDGKGPARTAAQLLRTISENEEHFRDIKVPLLVLHGEKDEVTPPEGSKTLVGLAASQDKTLKLYPNLVHDLVHEPEKQQVIADIQAWIDAHAK